MGSACSSNVATVPGEVPGSRWLGGMELPAALCDDVLEMLVVCTAIIADPGDAINEQSMRSALNMLQERHPMTRSRVEFVTRDTARFVPLSVEQAAAELVIKDVSGEVDLPSIMSNLSRTWDPKQDVNLRVNVFKIRGSAKRVIILQLGHCFVDGTSMYRLVHDLMQNVHAVAESSRTGNALPPVTARPLPPAVTQCVQYTTQQRLLAWIFIKFLFRRQLTGYIDNLPLPLAEPDFPPTGQDFYTFLKLPGPQTEKITSACKQQGTTVGACFVTATTFAAAKIIQESGAQLDIRRDHLFLPIATNFNMRKHVNPALSDEDVAFFIGLGDLKKDTGVPVNVGFWQLVREMKEEFNNLVDLTNPMNVTLPLYLYGRYPHFLRELLAAGGIDLRRSGSTLSFLNISSVGKYPYPSVCGDLTLEELYMGDHQRMYGAIVFLATIGDTFCLSATARRSIFGTQEAADKFLAMAADIMLRFADEADGPTLHDHIFASS